MRALLVLFGLALGMPATGVSADEAADKAAIEAIIHDYLLAHPEVIVEALTAAQAAEEAKAEEARAAALVELADELANDALVPSEGPPDADVVIVEFLDYRCGFCRKSATVLRQLLGEDDKLRIVYRDFPILGPDSVLASRVALAAHRQGRYGAIHDAFYGSETALDADGIRAIATDLGLDLAMLETDMADPAVEAMIARNHELAGRIGIEGTPAFIVGTTFVPGYASLEDMRQVIAEERAKP